MVYKGSALRAPLFLTHRVLKPSGSMPVLLASLMLIQFNVCLQTH